DRDADADVATGEAGRDENHLRLVARADLDAVAGDEGRAGAAVVAAGAVALPRAYAREGVDVEDRDADRAGDSDRAAARAGDDRDDRLLAVRGDLDVVVRVHLCRVVDVRVGVERDEVDADADTDAGSPGDGEGRRDADLVERVAGRDANRLVGRGRGDIVGAGRAAVDLRRLADVGRRVHVDDVHVTREVHRGRAGEARRDAHAGDVVAVGSGDGDAVDGVAAHCQRPRAGLARVAGGRLAVLDDAVRAAATAARQIDCGHRAR